MQTAKVILSLLSQKARKRPHFVFRRLYRYLYHPELLKLVTKQVSNECLPYNDYQTLITKLKNEVYIVGENSNQDLILAKLLYVILDAIYGARRATNQWKPQDLLDHALQKIKRQYLIKEALQFNISFHPNTLSTILKSRIVDGRLIHLLACFLQKPEEHPQLSHLLEELFLIFIQQALKESERQFLTPVLYQQQFLLFFTKDSTISAIDLKEKINYQIDMGNFEIFDFTEKQKKRMKFYGLDIVQDQKLFHRLLLLIPHREIWNKLRPFTSKGKAVSVTDRLHLSVDKIIRCYQQEAREIKQRYQLAHNSYQKIRLFTYFHQRSLVQTLAQKLQKSPKQIRKKYRQQLRSMT